METSMEEAEDDLEQDGWDEEHRANELLPPRFVFLFLFLLHFFNCFPLLYYFAPSFFLSFFFLVQGKATIAGILPSPTRGGEGGCGTGRPP
jgi:hypothetical protein